MNGQTGYIFNGSTPFGEQREAGWPNAAAVRLPVRAQRRAIALLGLALAVAVAPAYAQPAAAPGASEQPKIVLTLRGSNTIGQELAPRLAQGFLTYSGASEAAIVRDPANPEDATIVGKRAGQTEAIFVAAHGSATALKGLGSKSAGEEADIGMASRKIKPEERTLLMPLGDLTNAASEHVVGLDGIAVIVHPDNPIPSMTMQQLSDLFSGKVRDWGDKSIGGTAGHINLYARDNKSGTFDTFDTLALKGAKLAADAKRFEDSEALSAAVARDPNGIGFIGLPYVGESKTLAIAAPGSTPIRPARLTVATEDYALARRLYLYTPANAANPLVRRFVDYALSPAGQALVEQVGFVALTIQGTAPASQAAKAAVPADAPPAYLALTKDAERLSTDFRFRLNSSELDPRGVRDLTRLAEYLASHKIAPARVVLVGFGDNIGLPNATVKVSEERAKAVAAILRQDGIVVGQTAGFGAAMPIAPNDSEDGRGKNRRVEVFVKP